MHPHHHGSGSLQTQTASLPLIVDPNPAGGWDYLATPSCQRFQPLFQPEFEVIMHMQVHISCSQHTQRPELKGRIFSAAKKVHVGATCRVFSSGSSSMIGAEIACKSIVGTPFPKHSGLHAVEGSRAFLREAKPGCSRG